MRMINLSDKKWKPILLTDIFNVKKGNQNNMDGLEKGDIPLVSAKKNSNGYKAFVSCAKNKLYKGPCITINNDGDGGAGLAYYQPYDMAVDSHVTVLYPKEELNKYVLLFLARCLTEQSDMFNHGRSLNNTRIKKFMFMVPVGDENKPDYSFMGTYIKELYQEKVAEYTSFAKNAVSNLQYVEVVPLIEKEWQEYKIFDIFNTLQRGKRLTKKQQITGRIPYISSKQFSNGVDNFISNDKGVRKFSSCLSLANSGSVGSCFYHPYEFVASDHITHLKNSSFNSFIYLFLATVINRLSDKYSFNREINDKRILREKILLPKNQEGTPDYDYMEQYAINLTIKRIEQYMARLQ